MRTQPTPRTARPAPAARAIHALLALASAACTLHAQAQTAPGGTPPGGTPPGGTLPTVPGDAGASTSSASLAGSTVTVSALYPDTTTTLVSSSATVDAATTEFSCPSSTLALCASVNGTGAGLGDGEYLDIGTTTVSGQFLYTFDGSTGTSFNGFTFSGLSLGTGYTISGFTLSTNIVGLDSSDIQLNGSTLSLNLMGLDPSVTTDGSNLGQFTITLTAAAVPEPAPAALLMAGLLTLALRRRRAAAAR